MGLTIGTALDDSNEQMERVGDKMATLDRSMKKTQLGIDKYDY